MVNYVSLMQRIEVSPYTYPITAEDEIYILLWSSYLRRMGLNYFAEFNHNNERKSKKTF